MRPSANDRAGRDHIQLARYAAQVATNHILGTSGAGGRTTPRTGGGGLPPVTTTAGATNGDVHPALTLIDTTLDDDALTSPA